MAYAEEHDKLEAAERAVRSMIADLTDRVDYWHVRGDARAESNCRFALERHVAHLESIMRQGEALRDEYLATGGVNRKRLEFARWLVRTGKLNNDADVRETVVA